MITRFSTFSSVVFIGATALLHGELLVYEPFEEYGGATIIGESVKGKGLSGSWQHLFNTGSQEFSSSFDGLFFPGYPGTGGSLEMQSPANERGSLTVSLSPAVLDVIKNGKEKTLDLWLGFLWMSTSFADTGISTVGLSGDVSGKKMPPWAIGIVTRDRRQILGQIIGDENTFQFTDEEALAQESLLELRRSYFFLSRVTLSRSDPSAAWETVKMQTWRFEEGMDELPAEPPTEGAVESSGTLTPTTQPEVLVIQPGAWVKHTIDEIRLGTSFHDVLPPAE